MLVFFIELPVHVFYRVQTLIFNSHLTEIIKVAFGNYRDDTYLHKNVVNLFTYWNYSIITLII